jgi:hypothetical protein
MPTGWIITVLLLLPNLLFLFFPPRDIPPEMCIQELIKKKKLEIFERIGQVGCFSLPFFYSIHFSSLLDRVSLSVFILALLVYYAGWLRFVLQGRGFRLLFSPMFGIPLPMAVAPITVFFVSAGSLHAWPLALASLVLAAGRIPVSWMEWKRSQSEIIIQSTL